MSFKKRAKPKTSQSQTSKPNLPEHVRISSHTASPITSWGLSGIDSALGGGLILGTLTIITEDISSAYYRPLTAYLLAEGIHNSHAVALAAFDLPPRLLLQRLPAPREREPHISARIVQAASAMHHMHIAWRYQKNSHPSTPVASANPTRSFAHDFDLSQPSHIPPDARISCLGEAHFPISLRLLLEQIEMHLKKAAHENRIARVVVQGLSQLFSTTSDDISVMEFLCRLRALCRIYGSVAVATCARDVDHRTQAVASDAWLQIDSFEGRGAGVAGLGDEWLGVISVKKTFREGRGPSIPGKHVWVFKRGRRKYTMERATAAPDQPDDDRDAEADRPATLANTSTRSQRNGSATSICSSKPESGLEF